MRRTMSIVLILVFLIFMSSCSKKDALEEQPSTEVNAQTNVSLEHAPTATPVPTPSPTPVPVVAFSSYQYEKKYNNTLNIGLKYPSHWINVLGKSTLCYVEPVNEGETPARYALSGKKVSKKPNAKATEGYINSFTDIIAKQYSDFQVSTLSEKTKFIKRTAYSRTYTGMLDDVPMKGFIICTADTQTKIVYVLHFSAPLERYDSFSEVLKTLMTSVVKI